MCACGISSQKKKSTFYHKILVKSSERSKWQAPKIHWLHSGWSDKQLHPRLPVVETFHGSFTSFASDFRGLEPTTVRVRSACSAKWALEAMSQCWLRRDLAEQSNMFCGGPRENHMNPLSRARPMITEGPPTEMMNYVNQVSTSPRARPISNWAPKVSRLSWILYHHHRVLFLKPILGRSSRKPPDPPLHAYDQQGIERRKFHDYTDAIACRSKYHVLRFVNNRASLSQLVIILIITIASLLNSILGRSSRKPPDPSLHAYDQ